MYYDVYNNKNRPNLAGIRREYNWGMLFRGLYICLHCFISLKISNTVVPWYLQGYQVPASSSTCSNTDTKMHACSSPAAGPNRDTKISSLHSSLLHVMIPSFQSTFGWIQGYETTDIEDQMYLLKKKWQISGHLQFKLILFKGQLTQNF